MKNVQNLHNWQFQSLKFQKLSKLVPGYSKNMKKSPKVLLNHKVTYLVLWCKVSQNYKFSPCTLKIDKNGPWDIKTLRKTNFVLALLIYGRNGTWLQSLVKLHNRSLKFTKLADLVPGVFKSEKMELWSLYYSTLARKTLVTTFEDLLIQPPSFRKLHFWSLLIITTNQMDQK
jgi:hypothetical protein